MIVQAVPDRNWYVTMVDDNKSDVGISKGKFYKIVIGCITLEQAQKIAEIAKRKPEMKWISINNRKPHYSKNKHVMSYSDYSQVMRR